MLKSSLLRETGSSALSRGPALDRLAPILSGFENQCMGLNSRKQEGSRKQTPLFRGTVTCWEIQHRGICLKTTWVIQEENVLILGCMPEGQGSVGIFSRNRRADRHDFLASLQPSSHDAQGISSDTLHLYCPTHSPWQAASVKASAPPE